MKKNFQPEVGKEYLIVHSRKGRFSGRCTNINGGWGTFVITSGRANAMCDYNVAYQGESITVRLDFVDLKK